MGEMLLVLQCNMSKKNWAVVLDMILKEIINQIFFSQICLASKFWISLCECGWVNKILILKKINWFTKNIDFKEMNKIEEIDRENMIVTAQAGTKLKKIQNESSKKGLIFPVNIAPSEKCTIGGNVSTNVGGLQTLKYGNIEDHINGLEVVLSDGTILDFQSKLKKDNQI